MSPASRGRGLKRIVVDRGPAAGRSAGAIRYGDWKLIEFFDDDGIELYNLADDVSEKNNLAEKMPRKAAALRRQLARWRREVGAGSVNGDKV